MYDHPSRRALLKTMAGSAVAATLGSRVVVAATPVTIRFGIIGVGNLVGAIYQLVAIKNGVYLKHGIDLKFVKFPRGGPEVVAAAASGQVDLGELGTPILTAISNDVAIKVIGAPPNKRQPFILVVRPDIKTFSDLRHQTVTVGSVGGGGDQALDFMLKANGLTSADIRKVAISASNGDFAALKSGRVAGAILSEPLVSEVVADGSGRVLARAVDYFGHYEHSYVFGTESFIAEHPDAIRAFFAANHEAIDYAKAHRAELIAYGVSELGLSEPVLKNYFDTYIPHWDDSQKVDIQGMLNAFDDIKKLGYIDQSYEPNVAKIVDLQFVGQKL